MGTVAQLAKRHWRAAQTPKREPLRAPAVERPEPSASFVLEVRRRELARLARQLTARKAVQCCGLALLGSTVRIIGRRAAPATFHGVKRCRSVWECPDCMAAIQRSRAEELQRANVVWQHRGGAMLMLSLTLPHGVGDDLKAIRRRVATSWRYVQQGAPWKRLAAKIALGGMVRALEVTHGEQNGFHPHLHVALYTTRPLSDAEVEQLEAAIFDRWRKAIASTRHAEAWPEPNREHGVRASRLAQSEYLVKMGLDSRELILSTTKEGRAGNRTPLQLLHAVKLALGGDDLVTAKRAAGWWRAYARGMLGARQLTYSRGFLASLGLEDKTDEQLELDKCDGEETVAFVSAQDFNRVRRVPRLLAALRFVSVHFAPTAWAEAVIRIVDEAWGRPPVPF